MIITFTGHSKLYKNDTLSNGLYRTVKENIVQNERILFYCGGYGDFDNLCAEICSSIRDDNPNCEVVYVTPYILTGSSKRIEYPDSFKIYNSILYPPIEETPLRFAITKRNEWMINQADLIIAYVLHTYGGAYKALEYARRRKKRIINLADKA